MKLRKSGTCMSTETRNPRSLNLSEMSAVEIVQLMNEEDRSVAEAVSACADSIARMAEVYAETIRNGNRVFYLGAGTSGGLALLDAAEMPPTFGISADTVIALTAEEGIDYTGNAEDSQSKAVEQLKAYGLCANDFVIGLAASGSTPYVVEGLRYAKTVGAVTAAIACNEESVIGKLTDYKAEVLTGPEVLTGSTRLKAGTAEKMILNMLSTTAMVLNGKVMSNFMVDMKPSNAKLMKRAISIVTEVTGCEKAQAEEAMHSTGNHVKSAIEYIMQVQNRRGGD